MKINKIICAILLLFTSQHSFAQNAKPVKQFILKGNLKGLKVDTAVLYYQSLTGNVNLSQPVKAGKFTFNGNISNPTNAYISFKTKEKTDNEYRDREIILEPAVMTISGDVADLDAMKITGSASQAELDELNKQTQPYQDKINAIGKLITEAWHKVEIAKKNKEDEKVIADLKYDAGVLHEKITPYDDTIKRISYKFFLSHPNSYVTVFTAKFYIPSLGFDSVKTIYSNFNASMKKNANVKEIAEEIKKIEVGSPGHVAANFTAAELNGKSLSLSDLKGKYVMLDFWASWCVPCRKSNPHMIALYNKYKNKGFDVIGIAGDDANEAVWHAAVDKDNVGIWHNILRGYNNNLGGKDKPNPKDINEKFGIQTLPTKILIDPKGKIIGRYGDSFGGTEDDMDKMLASIFNK